MFEECEKVLTITVKIFSVTLFIFSLLSSALGAAVLGIGIFVFVNMSPEAGGSVVMTFAHVFGEATRPSLFRAAMFLVISGVAIIIYGVTSMMSVWKKSVKFMGLFVLMLVVCLIIEAVAGVYVVKFQQEVDTVLYEFLQWSIKERYVGMKETTDYFSKAWDFVQKEFECCGVTNGTDWQLSENWNTTVQVLHSDGSLSITELTIPLACCRMLTRAQHLNHWSNSIGALMKNIPDDTLHLTVDIPLVYDQPCLYEPTYYNSYILKGCYDSLSKHILQYNATILSGVVIILLIQIGGIILTIAVYKLIKYRETDSHDFTVAKSYKRRPLATASSSKQQLSPRAEKRKYAYFDDDFDEHWESGL